MLPLVGICPVTFDVERTELSHSAKQLVRLDFSAWFPVHFIDK